MNVKDSERRPEERFVAYLQSLVEKEDRASLAALRRGLGKSPGEAAAALRYVLPRVPANSSRWDEDTYFLVGTLFSVHQINWAPGDEPARLSNLGASFARLASAIESDSIEKRFVALLNSHQDDLPTHLRHAVALLKTKDIPINWARLLRDVKAWNHESRYVQRDWASAFWGVPAEEVSGNAAES